MTPVDFGLPRNGLQLRDLPVQGIASHGEQELGGTVHQLNGTAGNIILQGCAVRTEGAEATHVAGRLA